MLYLVVGLVALFASGLTLFSGFGLGTILTPAFALFFPIPVAVAATAVVHLANNLFKFALVGRHADWGVVLRFGVPAALSAMAGAWLLGLLADLPAVAHYSAFGRAFEITPVKFVVGLLILGFALLELSPRFAALAFSPRWLTPGGLVSGFFGGLSGNQGALRSAFLIKAGLSKEAFVATGVVIAVLVDAVRLLVYGASFAASGFSALGGSAGGAVVVATLAAFAGAYLGVRLIGKVTLRAVQLVVAWGMALIGFGLAVGVI